MMDLIPREVFDDEWGASWSPEGPAFDDDDPRLLETPFNHRWALVEADPDTGTWHAVTAHHAKRHMHPSDVLGWVITEVPWDTGDERAMAVEWGPDEEEQTDADE